MKKLISIIAILLAVVLFYGCKKDPDHYLRINNQYPESIDNVVVGTAGFGSVKTGTLTVYKHINEGVSSLSGTTSSGATVSGIVSISGDGTHRWTMTILPTGAVTIAEDK